MTLKDPPLVEILWTDAESSSEWIYPPADPPTDRDLLVRTIGFLVQQTKKYLVIAHTITPWNDGFAYGNTLTIPKGMVVEKYTLSVEPSAKWVDACTESDESDEPDKPDK